MSPSAGELILQELNKDKSTPLTDLLKRRHVMGSEYELYRKSDQVLCIDEMSNKFSITTEEYSDTGDLYEGVTIDDITPEEMLTTMIKGIEVCSYWMDSDEFKKQLIEQLKEKNLL